MLVKFVKYEGAGNDFILIDDRQGRFPSDDLDLVRRLCHRHVELPRHTLPSPQAFATAALAGMGWGMQWEVLVAAQVRDGTLVELVPFGTLQRSETKSKLVER